jgi:hypothetical protein
LQAGIKLAQQVARVVYKYAMRAEETPHHGAQRVFAGALYPAHERDDRLGPLSWILAAPRQPHHQVLELGLVAPADNPPDVPEQSALLAIALRGRDGEPLPKIVLIRGNRAAGTKNDLALVALRMFAPELRAPHNLPVRNLHGDVVHKQIEVVGRQIADNAIVLDLGDGDGTLDHRNEKVRVEQGKRRGRGVGPPLSGMRLPATAGTGLLSFAALV